jgi:hypothetical protein
LLSDVLDVRHVAWIAWIACGCLVTCDWFLVRGTLPFNFFSDLTIFARRVGGGGVSFLAKGGGGGYPPFDKGLNF